MAALVYLGTLLELVTGEGEAEHQQWVLLVTHLRSALEAQVQHLPFLDLQ